MDYGVGISGQMGTGYKLSSPTPTANTYTYLNNIYCVLGPLQPHASQLSHMSRRLTTSLNKLQAKGSNPQACQETLHIQP